METWLKDEDASKSFLSQIPNYTLIYQFTSKSNDVIETLSVKVINKNKKTILSLVCTRHRTAMENYLKTNMKM